MIQYTRSLDPRLVGKRPDLLNTPWATVTGSVTDLVSWAYVAGRAFAAGVFDHDTPLAAGEKSTRRADRWRGSQLIVIDLDDVPALTLAEVLALPVVQQAAAVFPSSSYAPDRLKLHILYALAAPLTGAEQYKQVGLHLAEQFPFPVDSSTLNPAQPVFGTVFSDPRMADHRRALDDGLCWLNPTPPMLNAPAILAARIASGAYVPHAAPAAHEAEARTTREDGESISKRVAAHEAAPAAKRLSVTLEAVRYALRGDWSERTREGRLPLLMAAHAASHDHAVRDAFLEARGAAWDASTQKATLQAWWAKHTTKEGGYTAATLFYEARRQGWLQYSSVELSNATEIYAPEVGDWLARPDLPTRLLLKSATGTGKTTGAIRLLKSLGADARAVFFAPSIKLCVAMSAALSAAGVENTLYIDGTRTKDAQALRAARVLVTTLQTFGVKLLSGGYRMADLDLVVIDESDELFSSFVRAGIGSKLSAPSHVTREQARHGVETLVQALGHAKRVLLLDGTATDLSRFVLERLSPTGTTGVYVNTFQRAKAPVTMFAHLNALRSDIVASAMLGQRVVVACDTKAEAALIETLLRLTHAVDAESILRIAGDTVGDRRVNEFFADVEAGAARYPVVIYNSAMGSGVSIVHTQPDVVYLIGTYLQPRKLLQMLNRYRRQVEVRAYVSPRETLYSDTVDERYQRLQEAVSGEAALAELPAAEREALAEFVADAALIAATDDHDQHRSVRDFFVRLLREDGRAVRFHDDRADGIAERVKAAKDILRERKADILRTWRQAPPLARGAALPRDADVESVARGLLHGTLREEFGEALDAPSDLDDEALARLALDFRPHRWTIERVLKPERVASNAASELRNPRRETTTFRLYFSRVELVTTLTAFLPDLSASYTDDDLETRAAAFIKEVGKRQAIFDLVAASDERYLDLMQRPMTPLERAKRMAKAILRSVGLTLKRKNGKRVKGSEARERVLYVDGLSRLSQYLALRGHDRAAVSEALRTMNKSAFDRAAVEARKASRAFLKLSAPEQRDIVQALEALDGVAFPAVVGLAHSRRFV